MKELLCPSVFLWLIVIQKSSFKDQKTRIDIRQYLKHENLISHTNWNALYGFLPLRKTVSPHVKNYDNFARVFEIANQLLARHSLHLVP